LTAVTPIHHTGSTGIFQKKRLLITFITANRTFLTYANQT